MGENATHTGVDGYIRGEITETSIADDFRAMDMGQGMYEFYIDYWLEMSVPYDTVANGGFSCRGGKITVRTKNNG